MANESDIKLKLGVDTKDAESAISTFSKTADKAFNSSDKKVQQMGISLDRVIGKMKNTKAELDRMNDTKVPTETYKNLEGTIKSLGNELKATKSEADKLWKNKIETAQYLEAKNRVADLKQAIKDTQQTLKTYDKSSAFTDQFREAQKEVDRLQRKVAQQTNITEAMAMKGDLTSVDYTNALNQLNDYEYALRDARQYMQELINQGQQFKDQAGFNQATSDIHRFEQQLQMADNELKLLEANGQQWDLTAFNNATTRAQELEQELQLTKQALYMLIRSGGDLQLLSEAEPERVRQLTDEFERSSRQASIMKRGIEEASSIIKYLGKVVSALKTGWDKVTNSVRNYRSTLKSTESSHNMSFKKMLTSVLKYVFGIRSIFLAYKKMRTVIKEGLKSMAKQFPEIASQVNSLNNAWWGFKSSIVSAFQPIFSYVVPALVTLINYLTSAMNTLANFFAVLTGQKFYYKAVKGNTSVAKSIGSTGSEAKKANEELAEYDKLLVIDQKDSGSGGSGGGGGGSDDGFNWVKEQTKSNDFIESLKKYWAEGDWEGLGKIISAKLTEMLNNIPWNSIYQTVANFGRGLAQFLNGLINPELFSALGKTIANSLKTALVFLSSFGKEFDWINLGESIAAGINSFFENFSFTQLANTFNIWANGLLTALITAVSGVKWSDIAQNIANGIGAVDAGGIMWKVGSLLNGLTNAVYAFVSNKDMWNNLGTKVAEGVNAFFSSYDFKKAGLTVSTFAAGLLDSITTAISKIDWTNVGKQIGNFIAGIDWGHCLGSLLTLGTALMSAILQALFGIASSLTQSIGEWFESIGNDGVGGFFKGIADNISTSAEWVKTTFQKIIDKIKDFFGIHSPSTVFAEIGGFLIDGLKNGLLNGVTAMLTWLKVNVVDKITGAFDAVKELTSIVKGKIDDSFNTAKAVFENIKGAIGEAITNIKGKIEDSFTNAKAKFDDIKNATGEALSKVKGKLEDSFTKAKNGFDGLKNVTAEALSKVKGSIEQSFTTAKNGFDAIKNVTADAVATVKGAVEQSFTTAKNTFDSLKGKVGEAINKVKGDIEKSFSDAKSSFDSLAGKTKEAIINLKKGNFSDLPGFIGIKNALTQSIKLAKENFSKGLSAFIGILPAGLKQKITLAKKGWASIFGFLKGTPMAKLNSLTLDVGVKLKKIGKAVGGAVKKAYNYITGDAEGGSYYHGTWHAIPQYAKGTLNAGSLFVAGEAGPEIVGNVKGRTEVLNASQIASAIRTAVIDGMTAVLNKVQGLNLNLNLSALSDIPPIPVIVTGQLLPLTEAFMFRFEEQHKDFEDVKLRLDDIIRRLSDGSNKEPIMLQVDGKTIVQLVWDETAKRYKQTGRNMLA